MIKLEFNLEINEEEVSIVIKDFIKTYHKNSGCKRIIIGLSGGIDSSVVAILCRQILGKNKTRCMFLPDKTTPKQDIEHKKLIEEKFDINCDEVNISNLVNDFEKKCIIKPDKYALANIKARIRMTLLYEYANMNNCLVCGTSNKSELLVGYFTKYGDGGVDIMPLGDLYKTQIFQLAKYLKIPDIIINKPPTAGLWQGQKDENELKMSYDVLDKILFGLERKININTIVKEVGVKKQEVIRIKNMRISSQHKRRSALIPKIGLRTPGFDWRSPIQLG